MDYNSYKYYTQHTGIYTKSHLNCLIFLCFILTNDLSSAGIINRTNSKNLHYLSMGISLEDNVMKLQDISQIDYREAIIKLQNRIDHLVKENAELKVLIFQHSNDQNQIFI